MNMPSFPTFRTETEKRVLDIWTEVLEVDGLDTSSQFSDIGGRSRHAMQIVARIREALGVELAPDAVFKAPTVAELARVVEAAPQSASRTVMSAPSAELMVSPGQEEIWCDTMLNPQSGRASRVYRIAGDLDVAGLQWAIGELVRRHESLRTVFIESMGRPRATLQSQKPAEIPVTDLTHLSDSDREGEAGRRVTRLIREPFDLSERPPWRAELIRLGPADHVLTLCLHNIICDGWSLGVLFRELATHYADCVAGRASCLPNLDAQYRAAASLERERALHDAAYWKRALSDAPLTLAFPWESAGHAANSGQLERCDVELPLLLTSRLQAVVREESVTEFVLYLAAFFVLLHRYTGEPDLVVISPSANRPSPDQESLIGFFARVLPLRVRLSDDPSFRLVLRRTRDAVLDGSHHAGAAPLYVYRVMEADGPSGLWGLSIGFRTASGSNDPLGDAFELTGLTAERIDKRLPHGSHLQLEISDQPGRAAVASLDYDPAHFERATIDRMLGSYATILKGATVGVDEPLSRLEVVDAADRDKLEGKWNRKASSPVPAACLDELVTAQAERTPHAVAVSSESGDLTYRELIERARQLAHHLQSRGLRSGATVEVALKPSAEMVVAMLGVLEAGCACMPVTRGVVGRGHYEDAQAAARIVSQTHQLSSGPGLVVDLPREASEIETAPCDASGRSASSESLAFVVRTAGVTGNPKAVRLSHRAVVASAAHFGHAHRISPSDRGVHAHGPGARAWCLAPWAYLVSGATVVVPEGLPDERGGGVAEWLGRRDVTIVSLEAGRASALLDGELGAAASLRMIMVVGPGDVVPSPTANRQLEVIRQYAIAEAGGVVMSVPVAQEEPGPHGPLAIGTPDLCSARAFILDRCGKLAPLGVVGELCLGGAVLASGYCGVRDAEAQAFIADPFGTGSGDRLIRTGDLARRREDGMIEFLGRARDEVQFRGFRLAPRLVELDRALAAHPAVQGALTCWDPEERDLVAYLVLGSRAAPTPYDLNAWIRQNMARWLLPAHYAIVDALPARADGSPDRRALVDLPSQRLNDEAGENAPQTPAERTLASIWTALLGRDDVRIHESFFLMGGNRPLGLEMIARAKAAGLELSLQALFLTPTIAELAYAAGDAEGRSDRNRSGVGRLAFWRGRTRQA